MAGGSNSLRGGVGFETSSAKGQKGAGAGCKDEHDQALVGAKRSRDGVRLGLHALSKPDDDTGTRSGVPKFQDTR